MSTWVFRRFGKNVFLTSLLSVKRVTVKKTVRIKSLDEKEREYGHDSLVIHLYYNCTRNGRSARAAQVGELRMRAARLKDPHSRLSQRLLPSFKLQETDNSSPPLYSHSTIRHKQMKRSAWEGGGW